jgi:hypoxanthine phosphoribosyltransferase
MASSYRGEAREPAALELPLHPHVDVAERHVLLLDDILDTGRTLSALAGRLGALGPRSLRTVTLLDKPGRRAVPMQVDFCGFEIPDLFVVGYGLDFNERYRNLPDIVALPPEWPRRVRPEGRPTGIAGPHPANPARGGDAPRPAAAPAAPIPPARAP